MVTKISDQQKTISPGTRSEILDSEAALVVSMNAITIAKDSIQENIDRNNVCIEKNNAQIEENRRMMEEIESSSISMTLIKLVVYTWESISSRIWY